MRSAGRGFSLFVCNNSPFEYIYIYFCGVASACVCVRESARLASFFFFQPNEPERKSLMFKPPTPKRERTGRRGEKKKLVIIIVIFNTMERRKRERERGGKEMYTQRAAMVVVAAAWNSDSWKDVKSAKLSGNRFSVQTFGPQNGGGSGRAAAGVPPPPPLDVGCWQRRPRQYLTD